jgi:hypothetical protein
MINYKFLSLVGLFFLGLGFTNLAAAELITETYNCKAQTCSPNISYSILNKDQLSLTITCINKHYPDVSTVHISQPQPPPPPHLCTFSLSTKPYRIITMECDNTTGGTATIILNTVGCVSAT